MTKAKTNETEKPMTNEEVENVANYLRRLTAQARARAAMISPWLVFEVGRFGCYFRGRIESTLNLPARGVWFSVDARIVGSKGDDFERVFEVDPKLGARAALAAAKAHARDAFPGGV